MECPGIKIYISGELKAENPYGGGIPLGSNYCYIGCGLLGFILQMAPSMIFEFTIEPSLEMKSNSFQYSVAIGSASFSPALVYLQQAGSFYKPLSPARDGIGAVPVASFSFHLPKYFCPHARFFMHAPLFSVKETGLEYRVNCPYIFL